MVAWAANLLGEHGGEPAPLWLCQAAQEHVDLPVVAGDGWISPYLAGGALTGMNDGLNRYCHQSTLV